METLTYNDVAIRTGTQIPEHLEAQARIPKASKTAPNHQGDVMVVSHQFDEKCNLVNGAYNVEGDGFLISGSGFKVVRGDADRNSHILSDGDGKCRVWQSRPVQPVLDYCVLYVPRGEVAALTHTAEHGSILLDEGWWRLQGQAAHGETMRRAAD